MRLIYADELAEELSKRVWYEREDEKQAVRIVKEFPTVDAAPVVRCRECKLHDSCYTEDVFKFARLNDDKRFCGVGERKGGDA